MMGIYNYIYFIYNMQKMNNRQQHSSVHLKNVSLAGISDQAQTSLEQVFLSVHAHPGSDLIYIQ